MSRDGYTVHPIDAVEKIKRVDRVYDNSFALQSTVDILQAKLGTHVVTGQIVLNLNDGRLQSFETKTYAKVTALDKVNGSGAR